MSSQLLVEQINTNESERLIGRKNAHETQKGQAPLRFLRLFAANQPSVSFRIYPWLTTAFMTAVRL
jgi:hypothetical protein